MNIAHIVSGVKRSVLCKVRLKMYRWQRAAYSWQQEVGCPHVGHVLTGSGESDYLIFHPAVWEALIIPLNPDTFTALVVRVLITHITLLLTKDLCTRTSKLTSRSAHSCASLRSAEDQKKPPFTKSAAKSFSLIKSNSVFLLISPACLVQSSTNTRPTVKWSKTTERIPLTLSSADSRTTECQPSEWNLCKDLKTDKWLRTIWILTRTDKDNRARTNVWLSLGICSDKVACCPRNVFLVFFFSFW